MKTNKIFRKVFDGQYNNGVELNAKECAKFSQWVIDLSCENGRLQADIINLELRAERAESKLAELEA